MGIFLHFLNREAYRAAEADYVSDRILICLRLLSAARTDSLYSNFSNLMEGGHLDPNGPQLVRRLLATKQLLIAGERPCLSEFIESRALRYNFDAERYPMYFHDSHHYADLQPALLGKTSSTDYLQRTIEAVADRKLSLLELHVSHSDRSLLGSSIDTINEVVKQRESRGITRSLFAGRLQTHQQEGAIARLISVGYIERYLQELNCTIASGVPGLAVFDHLAADHFCCDIQIMSDLVKLSGFHEKASLALAHCDDLLAALRCHRDQQQFALGIHNVCAVFRRMHRAIPDAYPPAFVREFISKLPVRTSRPLGLASSIFAAANEQLANLIQTFRSTKDFSTAYEAEMAHDGIKTVMLVTATTTETRALLEELKLLTGGQRTFLPKEHYIASDFGRIGRVQLLHIQCEAGSVGPSSSQAVITDAIVDFSPSAIIMIGIAFGANQKEQKLGDILVSKTIVEYEKAKIVRGEEIARGQRIEASPKLISVLRAADSEGLGQPEEVKFGVMLSGEKLIDSEQYVENLLNKEPEAIGGEMEGAGLVAAAQRKGVDWIVIKAIVDWARDKQAQNGGDHQINVARGAARFALRALDRIGL